MAETLPNKFADLFEKKALASLATLMADGNPQVTPVWCDWDGEHVLVNTAVGRVKDRNLQRDGRVALAIIDPDNAYRYLGIRGHVVERTLQGADEHIDRMAKKYLGLDVYPYRQASNEVRVIYKIKPERFSTMG